MPQCSRLDVDEGDRARVAFDKGDVRGTATQRFNPDRARPREPIQHAAPLNARRQHVEQRLAQPVGGRPQPFPGRRFDPTSLQAAGDISFSRQSRARRMVGEQAIARLKPATVSYPIPTNPNLCSQCVRTKAGQRRRLARIVERDDRFARARPP